MSSDIKVVNFETMLTPKGKKSYTPTLFRLHFLPSGCLNKIDYFNVIMNQWAYARNPDLYPKMVIAWDKYNAKQQKSKV